MHDRGCYTAWKTRRPCKLGRCQSYRTSNSKAKRLVRRPVTEQTRLRCARPACEGMTTQNLLQRRTAPSRTGAPEKVTPPTAGGTKLDRPSVSRRLSGQAAEQFFSGVSTLITPATARKPAVHVPRGQGGEKGSNKSRQDEGLLKRPPLSPPHRSYVNSEKSL